MLCFVLEYYFWKRGIVDLKALLGLQRQLSDPDRFPTAEDVLRVVWECQDRADEARQRNDQVQADEWWKMAELARSEYRQRYIRDLAGPSRRASGGSWDGTRGQQHRE